MRVLLVRPPNPPHTMGLRHVMLCEPLELEYVAAGLEGHEVRILDLLLERGLETTLRRFRPDVVGTSAYITGVNEVKRVCRAVKRWNPRCLTVVGGVHAAQVPEDFHDAAIDCVVLGDGTSTLPDVLAALDAGRPLEDVPGLALPSENGLARTAPRAYMLHPDALPFPRRDLVAHLRRRYYYLLHRPLTTMKTTWGCWYRCGFCFPWRVTGGAAFARSPESIVEELETIETEDVYVVDDIFLINRERLARLASLIRERGIRKRYLVYGRADFIAANEDVVADLAGLGLAAVLIGLEATTDSELMTVEKATTVAENRRAIEVLGRHGVDTYGSLIAQPDYGPDDWKRLDRFIEDNGLYYLNISPLTPLPGTLLWEECGSRVTVPREAHGLWDLSHCVLPTRMPLRSYYRSLLATYARACLDWRRARRFTRRAGSRTWSWGYWRMWWGAARILLQMLGAHRHHSARELARAQDAGPVWRPTHTRAGATPPRILRRVT
jgi:radical SAM superfamily enzyme YgiQ (UPF0313 family)